MDQHKLERGAALILEGLGVDRHKDRNFQETPERYARVMMELFNPPETDYATFPETYNDFVLLRDHRMYSLCPHHLLPVRLYVSLAYIPGTSVLGLSKLARLAADCNRQPLLQEGFTNDLAERVMKLVPGCKGAAAIVEGRHGCIEIRGVRSDAHFITYRFKGEFQTNERLQDRFLALCKTPR